MERYSCVEEKTFDNAKTFLDYIRLSSGNWGNGLEVSWIFRGQGNANWPLIPKAWRDKTRIGEFADLIRRMEVYAKVQCNRIIEFWKRDENTRAIILGNYLQSFLLNADTEIAMERVTSLLVQVAVECEVVREFLILGDELGYPVGNIDAYENGKSIAQNYGVDRYNLPKDFVREEAGLAQHHGVPTRLLDWTRKPEVAAFFAAESAEEEMIAVWAFNTQFSIRNIPSLWVGTDIALLVCKRYNHSFLHAQDGLFTWILGADSYFLEQNNWPSMEQILELRQKGRSDCPLRKLTLPVNQKDELLKLLWKERVSRAHLMPTYDNIVKALKVKWEWLLI